MVAEESAADDVLALVAIEAILAAKPGDLVGARATLHSEALIWWTVAIDIAGSFCIGLLVAGQWFSRDVREGIGVGFLGGFTTFSTFSVQIVLETNGGSRARLSPIWRLR